MQKFFLVSTRDDENLLTEMESILKERFDKGARTARVPSSAREPARSSRLDQLVLPVSERGKMPLTKDKYLVKENPHLVQWERETRLFLRQLSPQHGHRVSAVMIYEWATGISVAELVEQGGSASADLRKINQILRKYFGKSYMTYILGRKVPNAYKVPPGWYVKRHRPVTLTLYAEYLQGTLNP
jgi:hypothetical protein